MKTHVLGLDIGGANLKAAHSEWRRAHVAFALWKHPERLAEELGRLGAAMPAHDRLAVTMTGELCDCFATRREGVRAILQSVQEIAARRRFAYGRRGANSSMSPMGWTIQRAWPLRTGSRWLTRSPAGIPGARAADRHWFDDD